MVKMVFYLIMSQINKFIYNECFTNNTKMTTLNNESKKAFQKKIYILRKEQQTLIREYDKNKISEDVYNTKLKNIVDDIKLTNNKYLELCNENIKKDIKINEETKMAEDKTKIENKKVGAKPKKDSLASIVGDALQKKSLKNYDAVANKILEVHTSLDKKKIIARAKTIINDCKKGKGRWKAFTWSEENFLLTKND